MDKEKGHLKGKFSFKALLDNSPDKTEVICMYYRCKLSYHRSTSCLKFNFLAKHTADAENPPAPRQKQAALDSLQRRCKKYKEVRSTSVKWDTTLC